jgi:hypothetical protein
MSPRQTLPAVLSALLLLQAVPAGAQQSVVRGVVREAVTGQPVAGATVRVEGTASQAVSDAAGVYRT